MFDDALLTALHSTGPGGTKISQATFVSASASGCVVDYPTSRIPAALGTSFVPEVGEVVWVWNIDDRYFVMGPASPKPSTGTVVSVDGAGLATLTTNLGTTVVSPYVGSAPSAGQVMKLLWHGGPFAMLMSTSPPANTPPDPPTTPVITHTDIFPALDAGSYGSGRWWTSQVWASDNNLGAWFYGTKIADTIPAAAVVQSIEIYASAAQISGSAPNFALHPYGSKPGGSPSFSSATAVGTSGGWTPLPLAFGQSLRAGSSSAGVGVAHGGYNIFNSLAADGMSGALRIVSTY